MWNTIFQSSIESIYTLSSPDLSPCQSNWLWVSGVPPYFGWGLVEEAVMSRIFRRGARRLPRQFGQH